MKEWIKTNPVSKKRLNEDSVTKSILEKPQISKVCFDEHPDSEPQTRKDGLKRYPPNPSRFWGPKAKAPRVEDFEKVKEESKVFNNRNNFINNINYNFWFYCGNKLKIQGTPE